MKQNKVASDMWPQIFCGIWQQFRLSSTLKASPSKNSAIPLPPPLSALPFCAGENETETRARIQQLKGLGFRGIILTYARETVFDHLTNTEYTQGTAVLLDEKGGNTSIHETRHCPDIEAWRKGTLETIDLIDEGDYLALKLSGAGPTATGPFSLGELPPQQMMNALDEICTRSKNRKIRILVDAESQQFQRGIAGVTLELMRKYNQDGFALVYNTYQAYLKGTPDLLQTHLEAARQHGFTLGLKLVRGAYIASDERSLIHDTKKDTDNAYNNIAQGALRQHIGKFGAAGGRPFPSVNLFLASHNKASLMAAYELSQQRLKAGLPTVPVGYGQLHGMSDEVSFSLLQLKGYDNNQAAPEVYKCSTWGSLGECLAYLTRRAIENRDAVSRTDDEYNALKLELRRRLSTMSVDVPSDKCPGNLGSAILNGLINTPGDKLNSVLPVNQFIATVRSESSEKKLRERFSPYSDKLSIFKGDTVRAVQDSRVIILAVDPADIEAVLKQPGLRDALNGKLLISVAAGWTRQKLETILYGSATTVDNAEDRAWVVCTLPNIAALVSESLTAIEISEPPIPPSYLEIVDSIFSQIGKTVRIDPRLMYATTALGGSTPAFFAIICDALIDAAVAVGVPRDMAHTMTFQSMKGTAALLQSGMHPALLKDQGTSPEGCTIGGVMVLEEAGVRGHIGRALREAVTIARLMGNTSHVNDTRH
ncbi:hypothetical protein B7463_g2250, partial [Scytalidium lignicola]